MLCISQIEQMPSSCGHHECLVNQGVMFWFASLYGYGRHARTIEARRQPSTQESQRILVSLWAQIKEGIALQETHNILQHFTTHSSVWNNNLQYYLNEHVLMLQIQMIFVLKMALLATVPIQLAGATWCCHSYVTTPAGAEGREWMPGEVHWRAPGRCAQASESSRARRPWSDSMRDKCRVA